MIVDNEARISAVKALAILDTDPEPAFEDAVQLAATICNTPISLITVLDGRRQWFKSRVGLTVTETPQEQAFCAHAIIQPDLFIVEDATLDKRFEENPLVTSDPNIRFYAGMPLKTPDGFCSCSRNLEVKQTKLGSSFHFTPAFGSSRLEKNA